MRQPLNHPFRQLVGHNFQLHNSTAIYEDNILNVVLAEEITTIRELIRPLLKDRPNRPPKPVWCDVEHRWENERQRKKCLFIQHLFDEKAEAVNENSL